MLNFTKGKWHYIDSAAWVISVHEHSLDEPEICDLSYETPEQERNANGRLIAAAPDMYRTLVKILDDTQNGQFADENKLIALLNSIDEENREFNPMYPIP